MRAQTTVDRREVELMSGPYGPPPGGYPGPQPPGQPGAGPQGAPGQHGPGPQGAPGFGPGQPGGYPTQGGWSGAPAAPAKPRAALGLDKILALAVAVLGLLNFIWGFLSAISVPNATGDVPSVFGFGLGYLPALFFVAGLVALAPWEPKASPSGFLVMVLSVVTAITTVIVAISDNLVSVSSSTVSNGIGLILLMIFGIIQALAAVGAWLYDAGILKAAAKPPVYAGFPPVSAPPAAPPHQGGHAQQPGPGQYGAQTPQGFGGHPGPAGPPPGSGHAGPPAGPAGSYGPPGEPSSAAPSVGPQGGYAPQAQAAPGDPAGGFPQPKSDDQGDDGQYPDVTQQVRF
jgi:hypothetical protein